MEVIQPEDDFQGYMKRLDQRGTDDLEMDDMIRQHQVSFTFFVGCCRTVNIINGNGSIQNSWVVLLLRTQIWRETTWGGFAVRQIQAVGKSLAPFFHSVAHLMRAQDSVGAILFRTIIKLLIMFFCIAWIYMAANLLQKLIGREYIVVEQEEAEGTKEDVDKAEMEDKKRK